MVTYSAIRYHCPEGPGFAAALRRAGSQPASDLIRPLVHSERPITAERLDELIRLTDPVPRAFHYARALIDRRFVDAYAIWTGIPEVERCLRTLQVLSPAVSQERTIAVVLPGTASGPFGDEIDDHDVVARTGTLPPSPSDQHELGHRFDIALLNQDRYTRLVSARPTPEVPASKVVTTEGCAALGAPLDLAERVEYGLPTLQLPTSDLAYIPIKAVPWCLRNGMRPTLYNGDFYTGDERYQDNGYDATEMLSRTRGIVDSYLKHDVFFCHALLRVWLDSGWLDARGRLDEILRLDGAQFAELLEGRWGKGNG
jgi:hypothetical protein